LIVLGAGSSCPCGLPSVRQLDEKLKEWSPKYTNLPTYPEGSVGEGIFNNLWRLQEKYAARDPRPQLGLHINFERVLGEMISLAAWVTPSPFGNSFRDAVRDGQPVNDIGLPLGQEGPYAERIFVVEQLAFLLKRLAVHMRGICANFDASSTEFAAFKSILDALKEKFDLGIYNLNYDDLAVRAWPEAFTGFTAEKFAPREVGSRSQWGFIYHLHGSVHYSFATEPPFTNSVEWKPDLTGDFEDSKPLEVNMASGFVPIVPTTLIAGGYKLDQMLWDPAQTFYSSLVRHIHEADAVLLIGYGFGDAHVNRALQNRFRLSPHHPSGRPPVAVITKSTAQSGTIGSREGYEFYAWELTHTINTRFSGSGGSPPSIATLLNANLLEKDASKRAAIWHGGYLEIRDHMNGLLQHLAQ
jgi:hypothetical protein